MDVRELVLYSERVEEAEVKNFFDQIVKSKLPFLGFIDLSHILSLNAIGLIIRRKNNTVRFYVRERKGLSNLSALVFPFSLCERGSIGQLTGSFLPFPKLYMLDGGMYDFLDFMLKENIEELSLNITKFLGGFIASGTVTDEKGRKGIVMVTRPEKFLIVNLEKNPSIYIEVLEPLPKKIHVSSGYPVFEETGTALGVDNYDPLQHTLIAGMSGAGKTRALCILMKAIETKYKDSARIIVIDPHGEFTKFFPKSKQVNFIDNYIEPLDVGGQKSPMLTQLIAQLIASSIGQENKYSERVLFYAVHLLASINKLELNNISALLTDPTARAEYVSQCNNDEVKRFFDVEYNDIYLHHFNNAILPILNFIGEYQLYLGKEKRREKLIDLLKENRITVITFNPSFFGKRMISFLAGAIINQMYILAISEKLMDKPTILVVDEFPRVETRVTKDILSETRKFNLFAYLSCQYLGQLSKEVLDSIVSNVRNIISFKVNRQDAALLSSVMEIKVEEYFKKHRATTELEESKKEMFIRLNQRECIVRLFDGQRYLLPMKMKVVDAARWGIRERIIGKDFKDEEEGSPPPVAEATVENKKPKLPYDLQESGKDEEVLIQHKKRELQYQKVGEEAVAEEEGGGKELDEESEEERKLPEPMIEENGKIPRILEEEEGSKKRKKKPKA